MKTIRLDDYIGARLHDAEFKSAWQEGEARYQVIRALIKARLEKGLSQRTLAKKAKTTQAVVSRLENMSMNPSVRVLEKLAAALDRKLEINFVSRSSLGGW